MTFLCVAIYKLNKLHPMITDPLLPQSISQNSQPSEGNIYMWEDVEEREKHTPIMNY